MAYERNVPQKVKNTNSGKKQAFRGYIMALIRPLEKEE